MRSIVAKETPPPCFACCPAYLVVAPRRIGTTFPQENLQSLGIAGKRLRRVTRCLIAASRKGKRGDQYRDETRRRAADE